MFFFGNYLISFLVCRFLFAFITFHFEFELSDLIVPLYCIFIRLSISFWFGFSGFLLSPLIKMIIQIKLSANDK